MKHTLYIFLFFLVIFCAEDSNTSEQDSVAEARIIFDGITYTLEVFQCLYDYPAPLEPDEKIAFALDTAPADTPEEWIEAISGIPDEEQINRRNELLDPILEIGPVFGIASYENGMDLVVFYPSSSIEEAVFAIKEDGFIELDESAIHGSVSVENNQGTMSGNLSFEAVCP